MKVMLNRRASHLGTGLYQESALPGPVASYLIGHWFALWLQICKWIEWDRG